MKLIRMQVIRGSLLLWLVLLITGCIVYHEPYPYRPHYEVSTTGTTIIHSDIEWAVWEYYDWDYDIVAHLHSLNHDSDDVSIILFLAYYGHTDPVIISRWRRAGISWIEITTVNLKLEPDILFVYLPPDTPLCPPYGRAYGYYWKNTREIILTDSEVISLVYLKVIREAYQVPSLEIIRLHEQGYHFDQIVQKQHQEGREIKTRKGRVIREAPPKVRQPDNQKPDKPDKDKTDKPDKDKPDKDKSDKPKKDR